MAWQRKIPFGYQVRNGRINCHPEEAELVRAIFSRYLLGGSYSQIADEMTQQGVRYHQHNAQWNKHMVKRILENERYLGMDGYPQLVTDEEFLAVRLRRGEQNTYAPCPREFNKDAKRIILSHSRIFEDAAKAEERAEKKAASNAKKTTKTEEAPAI